jgi:peptide/nickel transport system substrate-binding protein
VDDHTVRFHLTSPIAGFIYAATQPIVPAHLLRGIPIAELPDSDVGRRPVGSGPFRMIRLDPEAAFLSPAALLAPPEEFIAGSTAPPATDALATPAPTRRPNRPLPYLPSIEFRFFDDPAALARAYRAGEIDAASGLPADVASDLGGRADSRLVRYPGSTVTTVLLNLRPDHPQFRTADVRRGLLTAIKRTVIATSILFSTARAASGPIPPASWAFDSAAAPAEPYDPSAAAKALGDAGWTRAPAGWSLPGTTAILTIELLTPDSTSHPTAALTAARVADDWRAIGLEVSVVELSAADYAARLRSGDFDAAIADLNLGLDPDLYPLLASSQVTERGTNVIGLQDPELDELLTAARAPGALETRVAAYAAIQARVAAQDYRLPLDFPDRVVVFRDTVEGPRIRQVSDLRDRFWDVLTWRLADGR